MPSSSPSSSSSSTASSSSRRVTFVDTDTAISLPSLAHEPSEASEKRPQVTPPATPPSHSPNFTSTLSTSGPYTPGPPSNSIGDILIQGPDNVTTNSDSLTSTPSDAIVLLKAKAYEPQDLPLHKCLITSNPAQWDMLINPQTPPRPHALDQFGRDFMTHHAFPDLVFKIQINCDILPWPIIIDIKQDVDRSPRIESVFEPIYVSLWKLASSVDFGNQTTERQHRIQKAYQHRCRHSSVPGERDGLRRIDFLEGQTMFLGLSPGNHVDEWHLHVGKEY
jgi:hypothetical protein